MKQILFLLFPLYLNAQVREMGPKFQIKKQILPASLVFLSGAADGFVETISHNYKGFKRVFPAANDQFFDPGLSFRRKFKNGDRAQGERFPGSSGPLVFLTDAYHAGRFAEHLFIAGAISLKFTEKRQKWWIYVAQGLSYWAINRIGFYCVYNIILK